MEKAPRVPRGVRHGQGGHEGKRADDAQGWPRGQPAGLLGSIPETMRIAVAGTRASFPSRQDAVAFMHLWQRLGGTVILHGCCPAASEAPTDDVPARMRGVDAWIDSRAKARGIPVEPYPAKQKTIGWPRCGPERNRRMVEAADAVVCFPGGRGTASTRGFAVELRKPLYEIFEGEIIGPCPFCREPGDGYGCDCGRGYLRLLLLR
jgi:hypothetical protein